MKEWRENIQILSETVTNGLWDPENECVIAPHAVKILMDLDSDVSQVDESRPL